MYPDVGYSQISHSLPVAKTIWIYQEQETSNPDAEAVIRSWYGHYRTVTEKGTTTVILERPLGIWGRQAEEPNPRRITNLGRE